MKIKDLFDYKYGVNLELIRCEESTDVDAINFVARTSQNNGVVAKVKRIEDVEPQQAGTLSLAVSGSVLSCFVQTKPYYSGRDLYVLTPKQDLSLEEKLFYSMIINKNSYRYSYGRAANKTFMEIEIPSLEESRNFIKSTKIKKITTKIDSVDMPLNSSNWKEYRIKDLFKIERGKITNLLEIEKGTCPIVSAYGENEGICFFGDVEKKYSNCLTASLNGSGTGYIAYHEYGFNANADCGVLLPKFKMNKFIGIFIASIMRKFSYKYNYGRKLTKTRLENEIIKLPINEQNELDFNFMERYIKSLPYSDKI